VTEFSCIGVAGAGFMGSGIAESSAAAGLRVVVYEPGQSALDGSRAGIEKSIARQVDRNRMSDEDATALIDRITWSTNVDDLAPAGLVIEAIVEDVEIKRDLFARLDAALPAETLFASNTSSIAIATLAGATQRADRFCGLHFFSPVPLMKLVEVVVAIETSEATAEAAAAYVAQIGKTSIRTKDRSGFVVNVLLVPYLMSAIRLYEEEFASAEDIDTGMQLGCGHPMGPLKLLDMIGLDTFLLVCESLYDEFKRPEYAPPPLLKRMIAAGRFGRKSGRGFYDYGTA
jgi:3-hydroxybutyryl-CoA dehydrogenase